MAAPTRARSMTGRMSMFAVMHGAALAPWTGPVERRDPASYRSASIQLTWRCANPYCGQWTMDGSYLTGRCNHCQTPRGACQAH